MKKKPLNFTMTDFVEELSMENEELNHNNESVLNFIQRAKRHIIYHRKKITENESDLFALLPNEVLLAIKRGLVKPTFYISPEKIKFALAHLDEGPV